MTMIDERTAELRSLVSRIERLLGPTTPEQQAALDNYGNPGTVAPAELIESSWGNATSDRVIRVFPDVAARDTWLVAPDGAICEAPIGASYRRVGGAWVGFGVVDGAHVRQDVTVSAIGATEVHVMTVAVPAVAWPTRMTINGWCAVASDSSAMNSIWALVSTQLGNSPGNPQVQSAAASQYGMQPICHSWDLGANGAGDFVVILGWALGYTGTPYYAGAVNWERRHI